VNLLGDNKDTIKKNIEIVINAIKEVGLKINVEKTKYMLLSRQQNAGHDHDIKKQTDHLKMWRTSNIWA
jgi:biotin operon repressor